MAEKNIMKKIADAKNVVLGFLAKVFIHFLWLGLFFIVGSLFITKDMQQNNILWASAYTFFNSIGIALVTSYLFTFVISTDGFVKYIINLLKKIVIERSFLSGLSPDEKVNVIRQIIKPTHGDEKVYSNIDAYYENYISNSLKISSKSVRSDYNYTAQIYCDSATSLVMTNQMVSYRLHPSPNGYEPIRVGYRVNDFNKCISLKISTPDGRRKEYTSESLVFEEKELGGEKVKMAEISLTEFNDVKTHLKVEMEIVEAGFDHWIPVQFQALQPTDGLRFNIYIPEGFSIKRAESFGQGVDFHMEYANQHKQFIVSCEQWLSEGAGLFVVVAKE
ncbi:hypothetical protein [Fibrobacter succinogenes]|uniref:hypothetical protein n=1 Tax=Fibrobacter succinogenes TaxID=833 RepID=UPI001568E40D|nr:hypothetical protein [Fibrobacter succinogenes]